MLSRLSRLISSSIASSRAGRANERGIALWHGGDSVAAAKAFRAALALRPRYAAAASNLGMVLAEQGHMDEALAAQRQAVTLDPHHVGARVNLAVLLQRGGCAAEAVDHLLEARRLAPEDDSIVANLLKPLMDLCDWPAVAAMADEFRRLEREQAVERWGARLLPFESQLLPFSADLQLRLARLHAGRWPAAPRRPARAARDGRLRIGYVSADFHDHATAHLTRSLYGRHDRSRFSVHAYSLGADDGSDYRRRIERDCDAFTDAGGESDAALARRIADDGIDILVDMKVHTGGARPGVFALRPAPVQVSYLGYPGTSGAQYLDYLIADSVVVPEGVERFYSEAIVRLPGSYQATDNTQPIATACPSRAECGLPEQAFVFCCFNQLYKIEPVIFSAWMDILRAVPGSVLWLLAGQEPAMQRLRAAASTAGIAPERLVFAGYAAKPDHLARHHHADLFLDTHDVNAHTTASDALWAGLPVLTWPGETFASRVAASVVSAAGLPELVMPSLAAYKEAAIRYATDAVALAALKDRLARQRLSCTLFDTPAYVWALEQAYAHMHEQALQGERASIRV
jgi:predicted O-linked N-acetylglucosamine transferase (SPINDLY family)